MKEYRRSVTDVIKHRSDTGHPNVASLFQQNVDDLDEPNVLSSLLRPSLRPISDTKKSDNKKSD